MLRRGYPYLVGSSSLARRALSSKSYKDAFKVLGLQPTATKDEVQARYRQLAFGAHQDLNKNVPSERMIELNVARDYMLEKIDQGPAPDAAEEAHATAKHATKKGKEADAMNAALEEEQRRQRAEAHAKAKAKTARDAAATEKKQQQVAAKAKAAEKVRAKRAKEKAAQEAAAAKAAQERTRARTLTLTATLTRTPTRTPTPTLILTLALPLLP